MKLSALVSALIVASAAAFAPATSEVRFPPLCYGCTLGKLSLFGLQICFVENEKRQSLIRNLFPFYRLVSCLSDL